MENFVINSKQVSLGRPSRVYFCDGQKPQSNRSLSYVPLTALVVMAELEKLLQEESPSLSGEALYQEGMRLYRQIEPEIPYHHYQKLEMSSSIIRSLVLHALRKSGSSLGVQSPDDILLSEWLSCLQRKDREGQKSHYLEYLLRPLRLLKT
jgi:hypothetical protein